ncbi:MFS transporter [Actinokineospora fastidiosa]|uniref:Transporter, MFS family protein n=1 Tax=Actinokineospora fastidiosa TaxID=1816 RepID=A0A918GED9_9PSEU|nr:MFS transporter [Actinokineospora fastidiosa]GGS31120.1 putative transporter, MFS family protein [Actinokineospora fastidiosa]
MARARSAGPRCVLITLCVTEITSWGVLFYAFPVLASRITATTGWSATVLTAAFSAGQLVAAGVGIPVGRVLDRHGPRAVMTAGSALGVLAVVIVAAAPDPGWFTAGWLLAGAAMGATLYPPAFAALTRWHGPDRVRALTVLTLAAGLASTVFAPLTAALAEWLDWRGAYLALAAILAAVTVPGHWFGLRPPWPDRPGGTRPAAAPAVGLPFVALAAAVCLAGFVASAVVVNLVPLLIARGADTATAAVALGLGGAGQVAGRLGYPALARRAGVRTRTAVVLLAMAATTAALAVATGIAVLIVAAVAAGLARGVFTLLHATAVSDRWGTAHYGRLTGLLSAPATAAGALAPFAGAALAVLLGGYPAAFLVLACLAVVAAVTSLASHPKEKP